MSARHGSPAAAIMASGVAVAVVLLLVPDLAAAGAAASLIFLVSFALAHWTDILVRRRIGDGPMPFRLPAFPLVPVAGGLACVALAVFQGFAVPSAGILALVWLGGGGLLYLFLFARRASVVDASAEAGDPELVRLRGRTPLVLVPIANPATVEALVAVADALAPPRVGRVLLHSVVTEPAEPAPDELARHLANSQTVLGEALRASFALGLRPEAITTMGAGPWNEIARVARLHRCESLLLGLGDLGQHARGSGVEQLMDLVHCDVVILRPTPGWRLDAVQRVLVPVGGGRTNSRLRARLLGNLCRKGARAITYLGVMPARAAPEAVARRRRVLAELAQDEVPAAVTAVEVVQSDEVASVIVARAAGCDLVVLGLQRVGRRHRVFGDLILRLSRETACPLVIISRRD